MSQIYAYEAYYYDECNEKDTASCGFVAGENYENTIAKVSHYYGEKNLYSCKLISMNDCGIIEMPELFSEVTFNSLIEENSF